MQTLLVLTILISTTNAQETEKRWSFFMTIHNSDYRATKDQFKSQIGFGIGTKFRINKNVKRVDFTLGFGFEQWPIQRYYAFGDEYYSQDWLAFSIQFGPTIHIIEKLQINPYLSLDIPFHYTFKTSSTEYSYTEFVYIPRGIGADLVYAIPLANQAAVLVGFRFKYNTLFACRRCDGWMFDNDDEHPFYYGIMVGYGL